MKQIIGNNIARRERRMQDDQEWTRIEIEIPFFESTKFASTKKSQQEKCKNIRQDLYNRKQILANLLNLQD